MRLLANLFFLSVLFPFLTLWPTIYDAQPTSFLLAILIIAFTFLKGVPRLPGFALIFAIPVLAAITSSIVNYEFGFVALRSLFGYANLLVVSYASYLSFKKINVNLFRYSVFLWFFVGLVQFFLDERFAESVLPRISSSVGGRGATGLSPEPSMYAMICLFFFVLNRWFYNIGEYSYRWYQAIVIALSVQLAITLSGMAYLIGGFIALNEIARSLGNRIPARRIRYIMYLLVIVTILGSMVYFGTTSSFRGKTLIIKLWQNPSALLRDGSISDRVGHIIIPFLSIYHNAGMGMGIGAWDFGSRILIDHYRSSLEVIAAAGTGGRIMSGWGAAFFELGLVGFLTVIPLLHISRHLYFKFLNHPIKKTTIFSVVLVSVIMMMPMPLAMPLYPFFIGMIAVIRNRLVQTGRY